MREWERYGGSERNEEMKSEWEGNAILTTISTSSFIQPLDGTIFYLIMNKRSISMTFFFEEKMYV